MKIRLLSVLAIASAALASCKPAPSSTTAATPPPLPAESVAAPAAPVATSAEPGKPERGPRGDGDFAARAKERFERMKSDLTLTEEQVAKIGPILDEQMAAGEALRADASLERKQVMEKMRESRKAIEAKISEILTPEQNVKWTELKAQREAEMAARRSKREKGDAAVPPAQ